MENKIADITKDPVLEGIFKDRLGLIQLLANLLQTEAFQKPAIARDALDVIIVTATAALESLDFFEKMRG